MDSPATMVRTVVASQSPARQRKWGIRSAHLTSHRTRWSGSSSRPSRRTGYDSAIWSPPGAVTTRRRKPPSDHHPRRSGWSEGAVPVGSRWRPREEPVGDRTRPRPDGLPVPEVPLDAPEDQERSPLRATKVAPIEPAGEGPVLASASGREHRRQVRRTAAHLLDEPARRVADRSAREEPDRSTRQLRSDAPGEPDRGRQWPRYTALPSTTASKGDSGPTASGEATGTSRPRACSTSPIACAISSVEPRRDAPATRTFMTHLNAEDDGRMARSAPGSRSLLRARGAVPSRPRPNLRAAAPPPQGRTTLLAG